MMRPATTAAASSGQRSNASWSIRCGSRNATARPGGWASLQVSTQDSLVTSPSAASISGTTRCGRTTSRPLPAWRRSRTLWLRARSSGSAWAPFPLTDISRSGSWHRSTASGSIQRSFGSGSGPARGARRSKSSSGPSPNCVRSCRRYVHRRRSDATATVPPRRRDRRRRLSQLDAARPSGGGSPIGTARRRQGGTRSPGRRFVVGVAAGSGSLQRLGDQESYYRNVNEDHRKHFEAMNVQVGSVGVAASARPGRRGTGAIPLRARPSDRTCVRRTRCDLAARRRRSERRREAPDPDPTNVSPTDDISRPPNFGFSRTVPSPRRLFG